MTLLERSHRKQLITQNRLLLNGNALILLREVRQWQLRKRSALSAGRIFMDRNQLGTVDLSVGIKHLESGRSTIRCTYCNSPNATDRDHVVPSSWLGRRSFADLTTPSCKDCNHRLGSAAVFTIEDRAMYVLSSMMSSSKIQGVLRTPKWSKEELNEMDRTLRSKIKSHLTEKKRLETRIKYLEAISDTYILESDLVSDRTEKAIIFDYCMTAGPPKKIKAQLVRQYKVSEDKVSEILKGRSVHWGVIRVMHNIDPSVTNNRTRQIILRR